MDWLMWLCIAAAFHAYFGYPLSLILLGRLRSRPVRKAAFEPKVSFIITVHNEERRIGAKLENTLALAYAPGELEIIVASDGSTDATHSIVAGYEHRGVRLLEVAPRGGKERAQKEAVQRAGGDILVFSDAATELHPGSLREIVGNFSDPSVGCVSSEDRMPATGGTPGGEGAYVRYEMWLRRLETNVNSLVGLSGSFFAARKEVCRDFSAEMQSDFRTLLNSVKMGLRGVSDPAAVGWYSDVSNPRKEAQRKVRTVVRGLTVLFRHFDLLNPLRYRLFAYQLFCHKMLRWLVPFFMAAALMANAVLAWDSGFYRGLFAIQAAFYGAALFGYLPSKAPVAFLFKLPHYFLTVNLAIAVAWWRYLGGERVVMWTPSAR